MIEYLLSPDAQSVTGRLVSARFDQNALRQNAAQIAADRHWYRLRRIDHELFGPKISS
jgi:hypothetical protein